MNYYGVHFLLKIIEKAYGINNRVINSRINTIQINDLAFALAFRVR